MSASSVRTTSSRSTGRTSSRRSSAALPIRTCAGCGARRPQTELVRLRVADGRIAIGRGAGRGAYLCPAESCARRALERGSLQRVLRTDVAPDPDLIGMVSAQGAGERPSGGC